jgi:hypothetical protein
MQRGLGNGSCGQNTGTLSEYCIDPSNTYSYKLRFTPSVADNEPVTYTAPTGTLSTDSYITSLTTEGASTDGNIDFTADGAPTELYNVIPCALTVAPGTSFTVKANFAGDKAAERTARLYIDRSGDGKFTTGEKIASA